MSVESGRAKKKWKRKMKLEDFKVGMRIKVKDDMTEEDLRKCCLSNCNDYSNKEGIVTGIHTNRIFTNIDGGLWFHYECLEILDGFSKLSSNSHKSKCLVCGADGDDLVFSFYCSNKSCRNFHS